MKYIDKFGYTKKKKEKKNGCVVKCTINKVEK